jgi:hypothetical protein
MADVATPHTANNVGSAEYLDFRGPPFSRPLERLQLAFVRILSSSGIVRTTKTPEFDNRCRRILRIQDAVQELRMMNV